MPVAGIPGCFYHTNFRLPGECLKTIFPAIFVTFLLAPRLGEQTTKVTLQDFPMLPGYILADAV